MISKDSIESAYCIMHQKERVYRYSNIDWQKDDIEFAIENYVDQMSPDLYNIISEGKNDFLRNHLRFHEDITKALEILESLMH